MKKKKNKNNAETPSVSWRLCKAQDTHQCVLGHSVAGILQWSDRLGALPKKDIFLLQNHPTFALIERAEGAELWVRSVTAAGPSLRGEK